MAVRRVAGRPDDVADPLPGFFVHRSGNTVLPGKPVCLDLLQDHPAQPGKDSGGDDGQQDRF
jgi:hypothetical protein